tara:strand:+ start:100607 stop:101245 length:639 start_codon:yes stop_codon:yes gene_type:complete
MYILGLTGPIASGKSTISQIFAREGIPVIDADTIVYDCYTKGTPVFLQLVERFGASIIDPTSGNINRKSLIEIIKHDSELLKEIEGIVHPQVRLVMKYQLTHAYSNRSKMAVLAVPLMFENKFNELCDSIAVCSCVEEKRYHRFMERQENTQEKWNFISQKQMPMSEYLERSDHIINTDCTTLESEHKTLSIIEQLSGEDGLKWHNEWRNIG